MRPYRLGLTGSVGMGKSTTAALFAEAGVPVWDADAAVHRLYAAGGGGASALADLVPDAVANDRVERARLRAAIAKDPDLLDRIEDRIHPLVEAGRAAFAAAHADAPVVVYDIPLLFETGADRWLDGVLVVSAPREVQRSRVMARPGMTEGMLDQILARQTPDVEKRARADFLIETDKGVDAARSDVLALLARIRAERSHA
jgi:dephospho-CoA kinase